MPVKRSGSLLGPTLAFFGGLALVLVLGGVLLAASVPDETADNPQPTPATRPESGSDGGCGCGS